MGSEKNKSPSDLPPEPQTNPPQYSRHDAPQTTQPEGTPITVQPTNIVVQTVPLLGADPSTYICRSCNATVLTRTEQKVTTKTHLLALAMCAVGLWCCVCVPYCMASCQTIDHYCPNCNSYIGSNRN